MKAYHLEIPDKNYALLLVDDGERVQVLSGSPESISAMADTGTVRGSVISLVRSYEGGESRWFRKNDVSRLTFNEGALGLPGQHIGSRVQGSKIAL